MSRVTVLLVEDNPRNLKLARDVLEFAGLSVVAVTTGEEALAALERGCPDVVLMDLQLPGIDGHATLSRLREDPRTADVPVVAVSALAMAADRSRALDAGFDGFIEKPISVRDFPEQVLLHARRGGGR
ncbi:response regulator [Oryzobacter telluris]|jgi:two-component system cell cycle response regulator DivK|uniref:response regulator n=1 Tax=Oryzobacter telluris TaxID=3149179 RepID=UPI00370D3B4F